MGILTKHKLFADQKQGGERAKLSMFDLSYLDMSGRNLWQADLTGALLCHCSLEESNFKDAILFAADMRFANMTEANFDRADLRGTCMAGANMTEASLIDADMRDGVLMKSLSKGGDLAPIVHDEATADWSVPSRVAPTCKAPRYLIQ